MSSNYIDYLMQIDNLNDDEESLKIHKDMFDKMQVFNNNLKKNCLSKNDMIFLE